MTVQLAYSFYKNPLIKQIKYQAGGLKKSKVREIQVYLGEYMEDKILAKVKKQLAKDYNCSVKDFENKDNIIISIKKD